MHVYFQHDLVLQPEECYEAFCPKLHAFAYNGRNRFYLFFVSLDFSWFLHLPLGQYLETDLLIESKKPVWWKDSMSCLSCRYMLYIFELLVLEHAAFLMTFLYVHTNFLSGKVAWCMTGVWTHDLRIERRKATTPKLSVQIIEMKLVIGRKSKYS